MKHVLQVCLLSFSSVFIATASEGPPAGHGSTDFKVHCAPAVRADFDRALTLLHHMTYPQARAAFRDIAERDPRCAMAHWGVAMTLFQPLWPTRPGLADRKLGWEEVGRARAIGSTDSRETGFIDAAAAFFENPDADDYWARIRRWADAAQRVHATFPNDDDATTFAALGLLATTPPDQQTRANADQAAALLQHVLQHDPDHPGAMHYMVHADDVPGRQDETPQVVRHYENIAPDNAHALHMPTHVYTRQGDWPGVVRGNLRSADAALRYDAGDKVSDEFPHAIEYLVYGYLQEGDIANAKKQRDRLLSMQDIQPSFKTAFHLASVQARIPLETRDWAAASQLQPRMPAWVEWDKYAWPEAISQFAHGLGCAKTGKKEEALAAISRLGVLQDKMAQAKESLFERNIHILRLELESAVAHANGHAQEAIEKLQAAADIEASTPKAAVTPGPTLPAQELLGDLYVELGRRSDAHAAYAKSLAQYPNRLASKKGLKATG